MVKKKPKQQAPIKKAKAVKPIAITDKRAEQYKEIVAAVAELFKQADAADMFVGIGRSPTQREEGPIAKQLRSMLGHARVYKKKI